jgi:Rhs element Vgr protein
MPLDPYAGELDLVSLTMLVDGDPIPDAYQITQVRVHKAVNRIGNARITLLDGDASAASFPLSQGALLVPGKEVELTLGYHGATTSVFKGIIVKHGIKVHGGGRSNLMLSCYGKAIKMTQGRKSACLGKTDSDVFAELIAAAGLAAHASATVAQHDGIVKYYASDWDFMVCRAEINGQVVIADDSSVSVGPPKLDASPVLTIGYGDALTELDAEIDARSQLASVTCTAWDFSTQQLVTGSSSEPALNQQGNLSGTTLAGVLGLPAYQMQSTAPVTAAQLAVWANAQLLKSRLARVRGTVSFPGNGGVAPGQVVELRGLGERFDGNAFVASVTHSVADGRWQTELGFGMEPHWFVDGRNDISAAPAAGLAPGVPGLQIAKVKQIDQDPDGQTRVLVNVPVIGMDGEGIWARLASGYATANGGIFFVPEIGDEVVLGFLNDDPGFPIVLGSLYSSQRSPPYAADAPNTNKAIVTKGQIKISMEDVKGILRIETPGGHVITLDDNAQTLTIVDSNKNKLAMSSAGIALDSPADISLKAGGSIRLKADADIAIQAGSALDMKGLNVTAVATQALSAKGGASAELKASGQVTVQAAMVMIN